MPRYRRQIATGSVQHVVSRFVNREPLFDVEGARAQYLHRAGLVLGRSDWHALAYALMSSHVHWAMRAGEQPSAAVVKPLHVGFASWLNAKRGRLGPVFADRHRTLAFETETAAALIAYIHNNPVRAGVVSDPADSNWTSHRAYIGIDPPPPWLDVEYGLHVCGFSATQSGRLAFHEMVVSRVHETRCIEFSGADMGIRRRMAREHASVPVEIATPTVLARDDGAFFEDVPVVVPHECPVRAKWQGDAKRFLKLVSQKTGVDVDRIRSRSRENTVVNARRLAMLVWTRELQRPNAEMARLLGISDSSAAELVTTASETAHRTAAILAHFVRRLSTTVG
jgi:hypothetical protein